MIIFHDIILSTDTQLLIYVDLMYENEQFLFLFHKYISKQHVIFISGQMWLSTEQGEHINIDSAGG